MAVMVLEDEKSWSPQIIQYLESFHDLFLNWELANDKRPSGQEYDKAIYGLRDILITDESMLLGYHCTRLTDLEIQHVLANGMQLPNEEMLYQRIESLKRDRLIEAHISEYLKSKHQSNESNRTGMIWFCFYPLYNAGQRGIERFFRSWGGESLYNSHERDPLSGPILGRIGTPCIIEAYISISSIAKHGGLDFKIISRYLVSRGLQKTERLDHEGITTLPVPPQNISRIIRFPDNDFISLTKCDTWDPPLD
jgi:hypothetical protein